MAELDHESRQRLSGLHHAVVYTSIFWVCGFVGTQWALEQNRDRIC